MFAVSGHASQFLLNLSTNVAPIAQHPKINKNSKKSQILDICFDFGSNLVALSVTAEIVNKNSRSKFAAETKPQKWKF